MEANLTSGTQIPALSAKRALWLFVVYFLLLEMLWFIFGFGFGVYSANALGNSQPEAVQKLMAPYFLPIAIFNLILSSLIVFQMTRNTLPGAINQGALASIGWIRSSSQMILIACGVGFAVALCYLFLIIPVLDVSQDVHTQGPIATAAHLGGWQRFFWAIMALLIAPLIEEFIFRGVFFSGISNSIGVFLSAVITTVIFIVVHIPEAMHYWPAFVGIGMLAIATILFRIKTKSFIPSIAVHFSYNLVIVIMVYLHGST